MRSVGFLLVGLVGAVGWPAMGEAVEVKQVLDHGDPANRIDLVFMPYGYQDAELKEFIQEVPKALEVLFADPLFREYQRYFNAYWVTGIPPQPVTAWQPGEPGDPCFDSSDTVLRARCAMVLKLREALADRGVVPDLIFIYQTPRGDGLTRAGNGVVHLPGRAWALLLHEFAHGFAQLADESLAADQEPVPNKSLIEYLERRPNLTAKTRREEIKWKHWIAPETPLPTPYKTREMIPGLYQGRLYKVLSRPTYVSTMGGPVDFEPVLGNLPFGPINDEVLLKQTYILVSPIDRVEPTEPRLTMKGADTRTFHVVPVQPLTHALEVIWTLDGTLVRRGEAFVFNAASVLPGRHTLTAQVRDHDPRVRYDPEGLLTEAMTWQLAIDSAFLIDPIPDQTVKEGQLLQVTVVRLKEGVPLDVEGLPRGAAFNPTTGLLTWTPDFDQATHDQPGRVSLKVLARDAQGPDIKPFTITVENVNRVPILQFVERVLRRQVTVGESSSLHLPVVDLDGEAFEYFFQTCRQHDPTQWMKEPPSCLPLELGLPPGVQFDPTTQTLTVTPEAAHVGLYRVDLHIRERGYYYDYVAIYINVLPAPTPPPMFLTPLRQGGRLLLSWEGQGVLQSANAITGPWEPVPDAKSPYSVSVIEAQMKFYRLAPPSPPPVRKSTAPPHVRIIRSRRSPLSRR